MALEIRFDQNFDINQQLCGGCFSLATSYNVGIDQPVMVGPKTETAKATGWGSSAFLGRVIIPTNRVDTIKDRRGVVHLRVPIAVENLSIAGRVVKVQAVYAAAHDLKALP